MSNEQDAAAQAVLKLLETRGEFPALAATVTKVNILAEGDEGSAQELSKVILDDYTLTGKVLRVVNSPLFPHLQEIGTVSRAIVVLGWNEVQRLALALKLFDAFPVGSNPGMVQARLEQAFLGAILARGLGQTFRSSTEQAFIGGLFHTFGELLVSAYLPDKEAEGRALAEKHRLPEQSAVRISLGVTYSELGAVVAKKLRFPDSVIGAMHRDPRPVITGRPRPPELIAGLAHTANTMAGILLTPLKPGEADQRHKVADVLKNFESRYGARRIKVEPLVEAALHDLAVHAAVMDLPIAAKQMTLYAQQNLGMVEVAPANTTPPEVNTTASAEGVERIFSNGIQETMKSLLKEQTLSEVLLVVLETMHRGLKEERVRRVVFALRDPKEPVLRYRSGLGAELDEAARWFNINLGTSPDIFNLALSQAKDLEVEHVGALSSPQALPGVFRRRIPTDSYLLLLPIVVASKPIGMFYVEGEGQRALPEASLTALKTLRDQVVMAIARSSRVAA